MKIWAIILCGCLTGSLGWAKTIVVSDIDDTLKISHVRSLLDAALNAPRTDVVFAGMPELFRELQKNGVEFIYLSNAPAWAMSESHTVFLRQNGFPDGRILLRPWDVSSDDFKLATLEQLVTAEEATTEWIFIGDNGERDPLFFWEIQNRFPAIRIQSYVHAIYPDNVADIGYADTLRPYATAFDLGLRILRTTAAPLQLSASVEEIVRESATRDLLEQATEVQAFPEWTDCHPSLNFEDLFLSREWSEILTVGCALGR